jgi:hypothetical protein
MGVQAANALAFLAKIDKVKKEAKSMRDRSRVFDREPTNGAFHGP